MNETILSQAIKERKPIQFVYNKPGKTQGVRVGNPHAVFYYTTKAGITSLKVHIAQTSGATDSGTQLPSFRMFDVDDIIIEKILKNEPAFDVHHDYNPLWSGYSKIVIML